MLDVIKKQIDNISSWFIGYIKSLDEVYKEHKEQKRLEAENSSSLFNLYEYIDVYKTIQDEKARHLKGYAKRNKERYDFRKFHSAYNFLANNKLKIIADLQGKITELRTENKANNKSITDTVDRIEKLEKAIAYGETVLKHKDIVAEYGKKVFFKEKYYKEHQAEIEQHNNLKKQIEKLLNTNDVKPKTWKKELTTLQSELTRLINREKENISKQFEKINHIKYAVNTINKEYGIDLSIEIDKAIKRGEKPSLIKRMRGFQKQIDWEDKQKEKARDTKKSKSYDMER